MRRVIRVTVSPLRMAKRAPVSRAGNDPATCAPAKGRDGPASFQEGCVAMCKGKAIAKRLSLGATGSAAIHES